MMKRHAVLIASPGMKGNIANGTLVDIQVWREYLMSNHGGAWEEDEIEPLEDPSLVRLESALAKAGGCDYVVITFSGHGRLDVFDGDPTTFLQINSHGDTIPYFQLRPSAARTLMVIDSCRGYENKLYKEASRMDESLELILSKARIRELYRNFYEELILKTERGIITLFGCNLGEEASDRYSETKSGGLYTLNLLACGNEWRGTASPSQAMNIVEAHTCASEKVVRKNQEQHPQIHYGRRLGIFPFAVNLSTNL